MIAPPGNTQIWIAAGVTDLRRGFTGLSALVQTKLEKSPMSGQVFIFRGRRALGYSLERLFEAGLIGQQGQDAFCRRVIFPCRQYHRIVNLYELAEMLVDSFCEARR
jgi:transposase